jgi:hypothetical protein
MDFPEIQLMKADWLVKFLVDYFISFNARRLANHSAITAEAHNHCGAVC